MADDKHTASADLSGTPVVGIRTDVYERRWEIIWMSKDDVEHFESRIGDKALFQNIALFLLSASLPLLIEKYIDYRASNAQTDFAIIIICIAAFLGGIVFQLLALNRRRRVKTFREQLFKRERRLSTNLSMVDTSASASQYSTRSAM